VDGARAAADPPALLGVERSLRGRQWRARLQDDRQALALAQRTGLPEPLARVLAGRGVSAEESETFLTPRLRDLLPDPSRFRDMDRAAARLVKALLDHETIAIFGDYDVDGATSAALLARVIDALGGRVITYVPDRLREGYGPNAPALQRLAEAGARVVVTVDCGTTAFDPLAEAATLGLDVIVVDHHLAELRLPIAHAVVNPNRFDEDRSFGQLAAVGVAFLLAVALLRELRRAGRLAEGEGPDLMRELDLVALGTVCDIVPLTGLNRAFVRQGLAVMARRERLGLNALADVAKIAERPGAYHLGFLLGPRVNAGGRIGESDLGVRLLTTSDPSEAKLLARRLDALNRERQAIEQAVVEQSLARVEAMGSVPPFILVADPGWHVGVVGIVASRIAERFRRPTAIAAIDGAIAKGSARSVPGFDLGAAIVAARQEGLLINGGGHRQAAGFTVAPDRIDSLREFLASRANEAGIGGPSRAELAIDAVVGCGGATIDLVDLVDRAGPFGAGNPAPVFAMADVRVAHADVVGERHVRVQLVDGFGQRLSGIAFRSVADDVGRILLDRSFEPLHVAGALRADEWNGRRRIRFEITDAARASPS
jgi:single-stranded-DNA-specific exonuclease